MTIQYLTTIAISAYLNGSWVNITSDYMQSQGITAEWGMRNNGPVDRLAETGSLQFTLSNRGGKYSPNGPSVTTGWKKGAFVKLELTWDGVTYRRFYGQLDSISLRIGKLANESFVDVTVLDWMDYAAKYPLVNPGIEVDKRADEALATIVPAVPIQPLATQYDTGIVTFPALFDTVTTKTRAYTELSKLALSEIGYIYLRKDKLNGETLVFESAEHRSGLHALTTYPAPTADLFALLKEDGGYLLNETGGKILIETGTTVLIDSIMQSIDASYGDKLVNRFTVSAYPKKVDVSPHVLYQLNSPMLIGRNETIIFRGNYSDPTGGSTVNAISTSMLVPEVPGAADPYMKALLHFTSAVTDSTGLHTWTAHDVTTQNDVYADGYAIQRISNSIMGKYGVFGGYASYYISTPAHADFDFGSGAFTIGWFEAKINPAAGNDTMTRSKNAAYPPWLLGVSDGASQLIYMSSNGSSWDIANGKSLGPINVSRWTHYEVCRDEDGWFYAFANGQLTDKWYSALAIPTSTGDVSVGLTRTTNYCYMGFDEFYLKKGECLHTANFTPPTVEHSATLPGDYLMNTLQDGTGTDISSDLTIAAVYGTEGVTYTLTNIGSVPGYITRLQARGLGVYQYNPIEYSAESAESYNEYGYMNQNIDQQYQRDLLRGRLFSEKIVASEKQPRTALNRIDMNANRSAANMIMFLSMDVGDLIHVAEDQTGIDGYYFIQAVSFMIREGGIIDYSWTLRQHFSLLNGLTLVQGDFNQVGTTDALDFGYVPGLANLGTVAISVWIYVTTDAATVTGYNQGHIAGQFSDDAGFGLGQTNGKKIQWYQKGTVSPGIWNTPADSITLDTWMHVVACRDSSAAANDPVIYIEKVAQALTNSNAQSGATADELGCKFLVGNIKTVTRDYDRPVKCKMRDLRVYDRILTSAEVTTLHDEGVGGTGVTSGLVFQTLCVPTAQLAHYTDLTLTSDDKILDNIQGIVGTMHGAPTTRII